MTASHTSGRLLLLALITLALQACVAVPSGYSFKPGSDEGVVVVATRSTDTCGGSMVSSQLNYEGLVGDRIERGFFLFSNGLVKPEFTDPPGYFHVRALKAGEYRLTTFRRTSTRGTIESGDWDVRFRVQPGKVLYLGELYATFDNCRYVNVAVNDERRRDGELFNQKMDRLRASAFDYHILDFSQGDGRRRH